MDLARHTTDVFNNGLEKKESVRKDTGQTTEEIRLRHQWNTVEGLTRQKEMRGLE